MITVQDLTSDARKLLNKSRVPEAQVVLDDALRLDKEILTAYGEHDPDVIAAYLELARLKQKQGLFSEALDAIVKASEIVAADDFPAELRPTLDKNIRVEKSVVLLAAGQYTKAAELLQRIAKENQQVCESTSERRQIFSRLNNYVRRGYQIAGFQPTPIIPVSHTFNGGYHSEQTVDKKPRRSSPGASSMSSYPAVGRSFQPPPPHPHPQHQQQVHDPSAPGQVGTINKWTNRGFGFITPDGSAESVFCHISSITGLDGQPPPIGTRVSFQMTFNPSRQKYNASHVNVLAFGPSSGQFHAPPPPPPHASSFGTVTNPPGINPGANSSIIESVPTVTADGQDYALAQMSNLRELHMAIAEGVGCRCEKCRRNEVWRKQIVQDYAAKGVCMCVTPAASSSSIRCARSDLTVFVVCDTV